jgi:8-oxo-dGTP pyrophosphatase MutT (NUDIX family)
MSKENGKYPSTIYRVSLKAIIRNEQGQVLLVQEGDYAWTFPGGGIEHNETDEEALRRELKEEANIDAPFTFRPLGSEPLFVERHDTWMLWIIYEVTPQAGFTYGPTEEVRGVEFKDPKEFKDSDNGWERLIYKWAVKK